MGAQNGDLELGNFEPHQFRILYTHINQIMQQSVLANECCAGLHLDTNIERTKTLILMLFIDLNIPDAFRCV